MPACDNPRDQGAASQDREFEELLSKAVQHFGSDRKQKQVLNVEPSPEKKRASAA